MSEHMTYIVRGTLHIAKKTCKHESMRESDRQDWKVMVTGPFFFIDPINPSKFAITQHRPGLYHSKCSMVRVCTHMLAWSHPSLCVHYESCNQCNASQVPTTEITLGWTQEAHSRTTQGWIWTHLVQKLRSLLKDDGRSEEVPTGVCVGLRVAMVR